MRPELERRLGIILGVIAAIAWLSFELYAGLSPAGDTSDCECGRVELSDLEGEVIE